MSTRGFLSIKNDGILRTSYNHSDSYPTWLGMRAAEFIRDADLETLGSRVSKVVMVNEDDKPSPEVLADLKARGFWQQVSEGDDWYAALRGAQGSIAGYIAAGYMLEMGGDPFAYDVFIEWGYVIDLDAQVLEIYEADYDTQQVVKRDTIPFTEILEGLDLSKRMASIERGV